jgi:mRNA interferase MazF
MSIDSIGRLPLRIVVPITNWKAEYKDYPWIIHLKPSASNGLSKDSGADAFQVKSISENRFVDKLGFLTRGQLENIAAAIALCVGFSLPVSG